MTGQWPSDRRVVDLFGIELPILQAPMAGACGPDLCVAVSEAGGLGGLPAASLDPVAARAALGIVRQRTAQPFNLNFFTHAEGAPDPAREAAWRKRLQPYYEELGIGGQPLAPPTARPPFGEAMCTLVEEFRPAVVSFHFGLPAEPLLARVRAAGCKVVSSATTVAEARWLEDRGCDAIIAQGSEAGGHRGMFLSDDLSTQVGTFALVPQVVDAVKVPVIAAGGIADGRGVAAAIMLGAAAVQVGTAYLFTPEATITDHHRAMLDSGTGRPTALTNIFSGRPARGFVTRLMRETGPMAPEAPAFPFAGGAVAPLRSKAEAVGVTDFSTFWSGQGSGLARRMGAAELTRKLANDARRLATGQA